MRWAPFAVSRCQAATRGNLQVAGRGTELPAAPSGRGPRATAALPGWLWKARTPQAPENTCPPLPPLLQGKPWEHRLPGEPPACRAVGKPLGSPCRTEFLLPCGMAQGLMLGKTCFLPFLPFCHLPAPNSTTASRADRVTGPGCSLQLRAFPCKMIPAQLSHYLLPPPAHLLQPGLGRGWAPWREAVAAELQTGCWAPGQPSSPLLALILTSLSHGGRHRLLPQAGLVRGHQSLHAPPFSDAQSAPPFPSEDASLQYPCRKQRR